MSDPLITDTLSAADTFSKELTVTDYDFAVAVWGAFNGTLTLQMQPQWRDVTFDWIDVATYDKDGACEVRPVVKGTCLVRIGFKTGDYTSGDANVALYRGEDSAQRVYVTKRLK